MKILHTIGGFGLKSGGTTTCTYDLLKFMHAVTNCNVDLLTPDVIDVTDKLVGMGENWIKVVENDYKTPLAISKNIKMYLQNSIYDIYHANGLWMYVTHITSVIANEKRKPFILTPHGMLYPKALARSVWKKKIMGLLWFNKDIMNATCLHATCEPELEVIRKYGYKGPIALIPNPAPSLEGFNGFNIERKPQIGFLGRLHPRKNVHNLITAWICLGDKVKNAELVIMGTGTEEYEQQLKALASKCKYKNITFKGFISGVEKYNTLATMRALCVPSDFENFGMIVTEALAVGTPVIASYGTPWKELNSRNCGWWIDTTTVNNIAITIENALSMSTDEIRKMGMNGINLVKEKYVANKVAEMMADLYKWIMGECEKPDFVDVI